MTGTSVTEKWADFISIVTFDSLPPKVVHQVKMFVLDNIGCSLAGYTLDWGKKVVAVGRDLGGKPEATVVGSGDKLHCSNAAYVNGKLANILDMDETLYSATHIGPIPVFPALNVGERVEAGGRDVILATALGYDFAARCGLYAPRFLPDSDKGVVRGDHSTMAFGTFASTIAAAKMLRLGEEQIIDALSCAAYFAPGAISVKFSSTPPANFQKYADMGWFCLGGIMAALCAQNGYVGDHSVLDGPSGLIKLLGALEFDADAFVAGLGEHWYVMDAGIKPYPTCRYSHTGIRLLENIIKERRLKPDDIDKITISTHAAAAGAIHVAADKWAESTGKELWFSQFSFTYGLACTACQIPPGPQWAKEETLTDPEILKMTTKIRHRVDPEATRRMATWAGSPGKLFSELPTSIEVVSKQGTFVAESSDVPGDSWNPRAKLSDKEIVTKFRNNACYILTDAQINQVIETVEELDKIQDVTKLTKLLGQEKYK